MSNFFSYDNGAFPELQRWATRDEARQAAQRALEGVWAADGGGAWEEDGC